MKKSVFTGIAILLCAVFVLFACDKGNELFIEDPDTVKDETSVSLSHATDVAATFFSNLTGKPATKGNIRITSTDVVKNNNNPSMYVVNYTGGGFVIIGATKDYYPVLAYSDEGNFTLNEEILGLKIWMDETKEAIEQSVYSDEISKRDMRNLWSIYESKDGNIQPYVETRASDLQMEAAFQARITELLEGDGGGYEYYRMSDAGFDIFPGDPGAYYHYCDMANESGSPLEYTIVGIRGGETTNQIGPLLSTKWDQEYPFNTQCPYNYPAGCVAVALGQIMKYHKQPTSFNWSNMPNTAAETNPSIHSTPSFLRTVGTAVNMIYSPYYSTSTYSDALSALRSYGYSATIANHNFQDVRDEVFTKRPVFMGGSVTPYAGGHAWVCDGAKNHNYYNEYFIEVLAGGPGSYHYTELEFVPSISYPSRVDGPKSYHFHMNWGYGGNGDGWFYNNDVNSVHGNLQYSRMNIYISK